jgi:glycosidase
MRTNPHVLEVNAHIWFRSLQMQGGGSPQTIADVPQENLLKFKNLGFDAIWLMGVWLESPVSRQIARNDKAINDYLQKVHPDYSREDIVGSQYSIYGYDVHPLFGSNEDLLKFKKRLNDIGIVLILDFAGNHLSVDHPLTLSEPEVFVRSQSEPHDKTLFFQTKNGDWMAHGKDPYFPPWTDTVQINHFNPKARKFLTDSLLKISKLCDGLRCDMVMLMLNKVFKNAWGSYVSESAPQEEFWPQAIRAVKADAPLFVFGAEVYWGLEWEVQEIGFDYTYDKILYDRLLMSSPQDILGHLSAEHLYQKRSIRFISNHDEQTPTAAFGVEKSKAAATVVATISGMRLFTIPQLWGAKERLPIQYIPKDFEIDHDIFNFYKKLLSIVNDPCFHGGQASMKSIRPVNDEDQTSSNIMAWVWTQFTTCKIVAINYSGAPAHCRLPIDRAPKDEILQITEEFTQQVLRVSTDEAKKIGLRLEFKPYECKIFSSEFC